MCSNGLSTILQTSAFYFMSSYVNVFAYCIPYVNDLMQLFDFIDSMYRADRQSLLNMAEEMDETRKFLQKPKFKIEDGQEMSFVQTLMNNGTSAFITNKLM